MKPVPHAFASSLRWSAVLVLVMLFGACGRDRDTRGDEPLHIPSRAASTPIRHAGGGEVTVARGDTLYGIAFRNGMDFRELAAINRIDPPYTIYVGQVLRLHAGHGRDTGATGVREASRTSPPRRNAGVTPPSAAVAGVSRAPTPFEPVPPANPAVPAASAPAAAGSTAASASPPPSRGRDVAIARPAAAPPAASLPAVEAPAQDATTNSAAAPRTPSAAILPADVAIVGGIRWRWPAAGSLLARFMPGDATKQGIDIAGHAGDPVLAAADGVVVYSGSGLVGYGELVIIKHSDEWLSAYGHNRKRLVAEGQRVRAGQAIAEMGSTGASRDELHFEIRRNGRPVDPLNYLPGK